MHDCSAFDPGTIWVSNRARSSVAWHRVDDARSKQDTPRTYQNLNPSDTHKQAGSLRPTPVSHHEPHEPEPPVLEGLSEAERDRGLGLDFVLGILCRGGGGGERLDEHRAHSRHEHVDERQLAEHDGEVGVDFVGVDAADGVETLGIDNGRAHLLFQRFSHIGIDGEFGGKQGSTRISTYI